MDVMAGADTVYFNGDVHVRARRRIHGRQDLICVLRWTR
jgi:hypothetical protein